MTTGVISYLSQRGLGTMAHELRKQLGITRQLVIPDAGWPNIASWANGEEFYTGAWEIERDDLAAWQQTDGIDTIVCIETPFGDQTFKWAKELGMKTILVVMWEYFHPRLPAYQNVDLYICPSIRAWQECPFDNKLLLPWPVDIDDFKFRHRTGPAKTFIHNAGSGGINGRKGTREAILGFIQADLPDAKLQVRVQQGELCDELNAWLKSDVMLDDPRITVEHRNFAEASELYEAGDVLIAVHKYDGHFLVGIEAMASGMPVITTDAEPMNELFHDLTLLVKVGSKGPAGTVNPHCMMNNVDIGDLTEKIRWCSANDMSAISAANRKNAEREHSWTALRSRWKQKLESR